MEHLPFPFHLPYSVFDCVFRTLVSTIVVHRARESIRINPVGSRLVTVLHTRVVDKKSIRMTAPPDDHSIGDLGLTLRALCVSVLLVPKVTQRKDRRPCPRVRALSMDKHKR